MRSKPRHASRANLGEAAHKSGEAKLRQTNLGEREARSDEPMCDECDRSASCGSGQLIRKGTREGQDRSVGDGAANFASCACCDWSPGGSDSRRVAGGGALTGSEDICLEKTLAALRPTSCDGRGGHCEPRRGFRSVKMVLPFSHQAQGFHTGGSPVISRASRKDPDYWRCVAMVAVGGCSM